MTNLNNCIFTGFYPETHIAIRNISDYLFESFNIPKKQGIPANHFEFKGYLCCGDKRCGKTWLNELYLAYKAWEIWGDDIDFFKAEDIYALIDAVASSKKPVHFILLDDQVSKLDSRNPMGNKTITELYFEIAHELKRRSELVGGNLGGLVIVAILTQNYGAIDLRLRSDSMFAIFKTFDEAGCKKYNLDEEVVEVLLDWKVRSNRITDYDARKWAFVVDINNEGCIIYFDAFLPMYQNLPFKFTTIKGIDRYREQRNILVKILVQNFNIIKLSDKELKEELYEQLDILENSPEKCRINPSNFTEIISRSRKLFKKMHLEKIGKVKQEQMQKLIEYLYRNLDMDDYQDSELKGELFYQLDYLLKEDEVLYISKRDFLEIIYRAKKIYRTNPTEEKESINVDPKRKTLNSRIIGFMTYDKPIFTIKELDKRIPEYTYEIIKSVLFHYKNIFKRIGRGAFCLIDYQPTKEELEFYNPSKTTPKMLIMEDKQKVKVS